MKLSKKTKIVCTIGPATESQEKLEEMLNAGMNVMRLNFSHGDFAEHAKKVVNLRAAMKKTGLSAAIMQDLSGPKFRIGDFYKERVTLNEGDFITLTTEKITGDEKRVSINYPQLIKELKPGNIIMVDDGKKKFEVVSVSGTEIKCKILIGGDTKGRRGINLPDAKLSISSLSDKDKADLAFASKYDIDLVAFSFVRTGDDVRELRSLLKKAKSKAMIVAKIETPQAIENFDEILELSDAIMVARGDLAIELGYEHVPLAQKMIIEKCNRAGKPVITATQMLESMIKNPVPTRAEVSDIANAILDGTDAIMLSEESTLGDYPIKAVEMMSNVARTVEMGRSPIDTLASVEMRHGITDAISASAVGAAREIGATLIAALTATGRTARMLSRHKPRQPIMAFTPSEKVFSQLQVSYGCYPVLVPKFSTVSQIMNMVRKVGLGEKVTKEGDQVMIVGGMPFGKTDTTNMLLVEVI